MSTLLLKSKSEEITELRRLEREKERVLRDFNQMFKTAEPVDVVFEVKMFPMGKGITAKLMFGESVVREYSLAENALLELNDLMLNMMIKKGMVSFGYNNSGVSIGEST